MYASLEVGSSGCGFACLGGDGGGLGLTWLVTIRQVDKHKVRHTLAEKAVRIVTCPDSTIQSDSNATLIALLGIPGVTPDENTAVNQTRRR
jgi:hypothetical protein